MQIELNGKRTGAARYSIPALFIIANKRSNFTESGISKPWHETGAGR